MGAEKIIRGLKDALAFARGDFSRARVATYCVHNGKTMTHEEFERRFGKVFKKMDETFDELDKAFTDLDKE